MAQQDRLFFLEDRDELWLTVKQRIAEISHSTPPLLWVTSPVTSPASEWARHGRLQDLIFISSLLERRLSWSVTSWLKLSRQTVKQKGSWVDRKVHWDTKPEAMWTFPRQNVPVTVVKSVIGPCMVSKHSCTVKKWTVQTMRVMTGKENAELPVQEDGLYLSFGRCNFWATNLSFSTWRVFEYYEQWSTGCSSQTCTVTNECCKCSLQKPSKCWIWMNWYQWNGRKLQWEIILLPKCEHLKSGRSFSQQSILPVCCAASFPEGFQQACPWDQVQFLGWHQGCLAILS